MGSKCRASDPKEWGADAIFTIDNQEMEFRSYYKLPAPQTAEENCVAHNGSLIPIPDRDVMVQAWYQGGISVVDFTGSRTPSGDRFLRPRPGGFHTRHDGWILVKLLVQRGDRQLRKSSAASISSSCYRARSSHRTRSMRRGTVNVDYFNAQAQQRFVWPSSFALTRAHLDQLERAGGLSGDRIASVRRVLATAERASGAAATRGACGARGTPRGRGRRGTGHQKGAHVGKCRAGLSDGYALRANTGSANENARPVRLGSRLWSRGKRRGPRRRSASPSCASSSR